MYGQTAAKTSSAQTKNYFQVVKCGDMSQIEDNPDKKEFSGILTLSDASLRWSLGTLRSIGKKIS